MGNLLDPLTFPLHGVRLIEASAGTGKTYTIAALYLRLVLGHGGENGFLPALDPAGNSRGDLYQCRNRGTAGPDPCPADRGRGIFPRTGQPGMRI